MIEKWTFFIKHAEEDERGKISSAEKQGVEKTIYKIIKNCWKRKMPPEDIAAITKLSIAEVSQIIDIFTK